MTYYHMAENLLRGYSHVISATLQRTNRLERNEEVVGQ